MCLTGGWRSFAVLVNQKEVCTADGYDETDFMISLNPGEKMRSLKDVASGGELSKGTIQFTSKEGEGTTVTITLPLIEKQNKIWIR